MVQERFGKYQDIVDNLVDKYIIETSQDMVNCIFSKDSSRIITVMNESEERFSIVTYCTDTYEMKSSFAITGDYIKAKQICQNEKGSLFAIPFIEDEVFKILIFDKVDIIKELDVSRMLGITEGIRPIDSLLDPLINVDFLHESTLFVVCFCHLTKRVWYFVYDFIKTKYKLEPQQRTMECTALNFPIQCFYDKLRELVHVFFRQGQAWSISPHKSNSI